MKTIDSLLNKVTMYRLTVYVLAGLLFVAGVLGFFQVLPYSPMYLVLSATFIFCVCWAVNVIFALQFEAPANPESTWITALILALIITPPTAWLDLQYVPLAFWAAAWAVASKYLLSIRKKHVFNPAALGVAVTSLTLGLSASWWVGTPIMVPFVLAGGLLMVRKIRRFDLLWAFLCTFVLGVGIMHAGNMSGLLQALSQPLLYAPVFFFSTVMLTEPLTSPPTRGWRILYGVLVGFLFLPNISIGSFYLTPELALLMGNVFSYLVSPKYKLVLTLDTVTRLSSDVYEFAFTPDRSLSFRPGQYLEWTLVHPHSDDRSVRRYFTIASSPTEHEVKLGVKFYEPASTFKRALLSMQSGQSLVVSQLAGDFVLPRDKKKKLAFIAGGIGVTPFRSMIQYLLDTREPRSAVLFYANKTPADAVYADIFARAQQELGIKTVYTFSDKSISLPPGTYPTLDAQVIAKEMPDYRERVFYISGPQGMVVAFKDTLTQMGVKRSNIKTDYFPGFA